MIFVFKCQLMRRTREARTFSVFYFWGGRGDFFGFNSLPQIENF